MDGVVAQYGLQYRTVAHEHQLGHGSGSSRLWQVDLKKRAVWPANETTQNREIEEKTRGHESDYTKCCKIVETNHMFESVCRVNSERTCDALSVDAEGSRV